MPLTFFYLFFSVEFFISHSLSSPSALFNLSLFTSLFFDHGQHSLTMLRTTLQQHSQYICIYIYQQQPNQPPLREYLSLNSEQINEPLKSWKILDLRPILEGILVKQVLILISATPGSFSQSSQSCLHLFLSFHLFH